MHEITLTDIKSYIATVPEGEPVGIPQHNGDCLIGKAAQHKYPDVFVLVGPRNKYIEIEDDTLDTPADVEAIGEKFDSLWPRWSFSWDYEDYEPITLAVLREKLPELFS